MEEKADELKYKAMDDFDEFLSQNGLDRQMGFVDFKKAD